MLKTPNYNLNKPTLLDTVNVEDLNTNSDIIDTELKRIDDKVPILTKLSIENALGFSVNKSVPSNAVFTDTIVDISGKADKSYVDNKVKTNVPIDAVFTDTIYEHPSTHPASMIIVDENRNFVSNTQIDNWNNKQEPLIAGSNISISNDNVISASDDSTIIEDNLTSISTDKALSANQGRILNDKITTNINSITNKADTSYVDDKVKTDVPLNAKFTDTIVDISGKADISYINDRVKTEVPIEAVFTDTITSINGKTGIINKEDIVALGIPAQDTVVNIDDMATQEYVNSRVKTPVPLNAKFTDTIVDVSQFVTDSYLDEIVKTKVPENAKFTDTVYSHPSTHPYSMITGTPTTLPANGGNADTVGGFTVGVSVPAGAVFTDTVYSHPVNHPPSIISQDANNRFVTDTEKATWNGKSNFSGNYNDLTSKPIIPTSTNQLVNNSGFITISDVPNEITVGVIKPTDGSMWYEVI